MGSVQPLLAMPGARPGRVVRGREDSGKASLGLHAFTRRLRWRSFKGGVSLGTTYL